MYQNISTKIKNPSYWVFLLSFTFGLFFLIITFTNYTSWNFTIDTDLAAQYGNFIGGFFGSIIGIINLILLFHIFNEQIKDKKEENFHLLCNNTISNITENNKNLPKIAEYVIYVNAGNSQNYIDPYNKYKTFSLVRIDTYYNYSKLHSIKNVIDNVIKLIIVSNSTFKCKFFVEINTKDNNLKKKYIYVNTNKLDVTNINKLTKIKNNIDQNKQLNNIEKDEHFIKEILINNIDKVYLNKVVFDEIIPQIFEVYKSYLKIITYNKNNKEIEAIFKNFFLNRLNIDIKCLFLIKYFNYKVDKEPSKDLLSYFLEKEFISENDLNYSFTLEYLYSKYFKV